MVAEAGAAEPPVEITALGQACRAAEDSVRSLEVSRTAIGWLARLSGEGGESAWTRPAVASFFDSAGRSEEAERFFAELKELGLAVRAIEVERRYAPWAAVTAIADVPATTLAPSSLAATPAVWFARWVGCVQRLGSSWGELRPFLETLAEEAPALEDEESVEGAAPAGVGAFVRMLDALIEPIPERIDLACGPQALADLQDEAAFRHLLATVPEGAVEWAFRGRFVRYPDGSEFRFLRFPRLAELVGPPAPQVRIELSVDGSDARIPVGVAATLGSYLRVAAPALLPEVVGFAGRCGRALARFQRSFASELVVMALARDLPGVGTESGGRP